MGRADGATGIDGTSSGADPRFGKQTVGGEAGIVLEESLNVQIGAAIAPFPTPGQCTRIYSCSSLFVRLYLVLLFTLTP